MILAPLLAHQLKLAYPFAPDFSSRRRSMKTIRIAAVVAATALMGCSQSTGPTTAAQPTVSYQTNTNNPPTTTSNNTGNNNTGSNSSTNNNPPKTANH
jgi:hypothetical protein